VTDHRAIHHYEGLNYFDREAQRQWMQSLRPRTASIERVFLDGDTDHPLADALAWLEPIRQVGVGERPGYLRSQPAAVLHRYPYDRTILQALDRLGGLFEHAPTQSGDRVLFTALGDVDVSFLDRNGAIIGSTVTQEGLILIPQGGIPPQ
jgi:hypothetical protein